MRYNYAVLVFKKQAVDAHADLDFERTCREIRRFAHENGLEDGQLETALKALISGKYERSVAASEIDGEADG